MLTTQLTNELAPTLLRSEIDERIAKVRPSSTPLDQISRMVGARKAKSMKVEYYSVDIKDGASKTSRSLRGVTLAAGQSFELPVENAAIFTETETVLLPSVIIPKGSYKGQQIGRAHV